jgi:PTS system mannose-specific IIA component
MIAMIVITHGQFGQELLRTAQDIAGRQDGVSALSVTPDMGLDQASQGLADAMQRLSPADGYLILVDMLGGTPCNTSLLKTKDLPCEIVTGVNLYMLLSGFTHRGAMDLNALAAKVAEDGRRAIVLPKDMLKKRMA